MSGVIDNTVVDDWKNKANKALEGAAWNNATTGPSYKPWNNGFWACLTPPALCGITCCFPCVTFGKTYHRIKHNGDMTGYEPINTSCLLFWLSGCVGVGPCLAQAIQRKDLREKHNLQGNCTEDMILGFFCMCCSLMQSEKEAEELEKNNKNVVSEQYGGAGHEAMVMPGQK